MSFKVISTDQAPQAIGTYSQAVRAGDTVYLSGQIPLDPESMELVDGDFAAQAHRVFRNLQAVCESAGSHLSGIVKLQVYLTDLENFAELNSVMSQYFQTPYPARAAVQVSALPKGAALEIDAVLWLGNGAD